MTTYPLEYRLAKVWILCGALSVFWFPRAVQGCAKTEYMGFDVFGTEQLDKKKIEVVVGEKIATLACVSAEGNSEKSAALRKDITEELGKLGSFAYVGLSVVHYFNASIRTYVTVDLVDSKERETRMPFRDPPTQEFQDPRGLILLWSEYEDTALNLGFGEVNPDPEQCPAFHCLFGFDHPQLQPYEKQFREGVQRVWARLKKILRFAKNPRIRGAAAFLLAHSKDGEKLVELLLEAMKDPDSHVRNNAMRVLAYISQHRRDVRIPIAPVVRALNFPATTDRNKAAAILDGLADNPGHKDFLLREAGPILLEMLSLNQPNNHDLAYGILKKVSGEDFGDRDLRAWEEWLARELRDRGAARSGCAGAIYYNGCSGTRSTLLSVPPSPGGSGQRVRERQRWPGEPHRYPRSAPRLSLSSSESPSAGP